MSGTFVKKNRSKTYWYFDFRDLNLQNLELESLITKKCLETHLVIFVNQSGHYTALVRFTFKNPYKPRTSFMNVSY